MTAPANVATPQPLYARPAVVLSLLAICVLVTALLVKTPNTGREGDPRLTARSTAPLGAKLFYELAGRLGYTTVLDTTFHVSTGSQAIFAVLDPVVDLKPTEVHEILQHVRAGGALLAVLGDNTGALADSLDIAVDAFGGFVIPTLGSSRQCKSATVFTQNGLWLGPATLYALTVPDHLKKRVRTFTFVEPYASRRSATHPPRSATIGMQYGEGRVVVASDPDVLRNDALRNCGYGLDMAAADALGYLTEGGDIPRRTLVFDEFHQRAAIRVGMTDLMRKYLVETPSGRSLLQICLAGVVLLIAAIPRVLPPREDRRLERRSPLEHVDALARAYAQVGATRTGVLRLVRGLQRRLLGSNKRATTVRNEDEFLSRIAESKPALVADVAAIRHALNNTVSQAEFIDVGNAINRVEATLTRT